MSVVWATAVYEKSRPGMLTVTRQPGGVIEDVPVVVTQDAPALRSLVSTPWTAAPGASWAEYAPGCWQIAVYRHGEP